MPVQVEYMDAGTPITNQHYLAACKGEIYGADHGTSRFTAEVCAAIRPQTPIKNLFLTGLCVRVRIKSVQLCVMLHDYVFGPLLPHLFSAGVFFSVRPGHRFVWFRGGHRRSYGLRLCYSQPQPLQGRLGTQKETETCQ